MRSRQLEAALTEFIQAAAAHLAGEVAAGAEVSFEVTSSAGRRVRGSPQLYCYRALTGAFIAERESALTALPAYAEAARLLEHFDGLERYLAGSGLDEAGSQARVRAAIRVLLEDVFAERTDFALSPERLNAALQRLAQSDFASTSEMTIVATLQGLAIASAEVSLTKGLTIAQPDALAGVPSEVLSRGGGVAPEHHLIVVLVTDDDDPGLAESRGREVLRELLRALRLFGDGRVTLGALAWVRHGVGTWRPLALGTGGRPAGMLVVSAEQEDELRAFCSLVSRRAPDANELAWALRRYEMGCERESAEEAVSDYLMALRALLEPEGPSSGLLAGRLAALCATPDQRAVLTERVVEAVALERNVIVGAPVRARRASKKAAAAQGAGRGLVEELAGHLRALLRDVICGHLAPDLTTLADELLAADDLAEGQAEPEQEPAVAPAV